MSPTCKFENGVCKQCGRKNDQVLRMCPAYLATKPKLAKVAKPREVRQQRGPGLVQKAWNYAKAVTKWKAAGSPERSQPEIDRIMSICEACEHFRGKGTRPHCNLCGCSLSRIPDGLKSKIAMATESCPLDPPRWVAES